MSQHSLLDRLIIQADNGLRTLTGAHQEKRPSPMNNAKSTPQDTSQPQQKTPSLDADERQKSAALMRINHCGEVCAQALYQGQALTAKSHDTVASMQDAADEEIDHLRWCEQRLEQLDSRTSYLNPLWYGLSFSLGAATGLLGDKISLGFVAATEQQVCQHLEEHLEQLPQNDHASRDIIEQMLIDERQHGEQALAQGGADFPKPIKFLMTGISKVMTKSSYYI